MTVVLTMISISIKQVQLSVDTRDSEIAFHAASAGLECVRHWRRAERDAFEDGNDSIQVQCFGEDIPVEINGEVSSLAANDSNLNDVDTGSSVYIYDMEATWALGDAERCSRVRMVLLNNSSDSSDSLTLSNMTDYIPGYPVNQASCEPGGRCTIFSSQGYSNACPMVTGARFPLGTIQRDILVEF